MRPPGPVGKREHRVAVAKRLSRNDDVMMFLYKILTFLIYGVIYPVGRIKAARRGGELWRARLGLTVATGPRDVWLHAASVGEVSVLAYLIDFLARKDPTLSFHVTVVTRAGFKTATEMLSAGTDSVTISFLPLDVGRLMRRTLEAVNPTVLVVAETEIWPNLITEANAKGIPIILINGRMSEKAFGRYRLGRPLLRGLLRHYDRLFCRTETDSRRFRHFGAPPERILVVGDMKFDAPLPPRSEGRHREIRARAGVSNDEFLFVAGSTRSGEEAMLANVFNAVASKHEKFRMLLAPRHIDRTAEIMSLLDSKGIAYTMYGHAEKGQRIILVDKMGVLKDLYQAAALAFVGGTLVDIGGHNILEPVWAGTPVLFGPYTSNVTEAADYVLGNNFGEQVDSERDLIDVVQQVLAGSLSFAVKSELDLGKSPTAQVGAYILSKLTHV